MNASLERIAGVETIKTLAAAVGVPSFTVASLAESSAVAPRAVDTVLRRYPAMFETLTPAAPTGVGRPPTRWRLRAERIDDVAARVGELQSALGGERGLLELKPPEPDLTEASLLMAADAVASASPNDPDVASLLLSAARDSLVAAGVDPDSSTPAEFDNVDLWHRARAIASVIDVVDACMEGDQERIDDAQARSLPMVVEAAANMPADQWLPLVRRVIEAPGTVIAAPVLVGVPHESLTALFPTLTVQEHDQVPEGYSYLCDSRSMLPASDPVTCLLFPHDEPELEGLFSRNIRGPMSCVVVSDQPAILGSALEHGAHFVLHRSDTTTRASIAKVVNRLAMGLGQD
ncbi:MAG: hypothetical protein LC808_26680 [Actinobacteria bacterium]|nr:hypothetical protein [Actinomycetota bacterium]